MGRVAHGGNMHLMEACRLPAPRVESELHAQFNGHAIGQTDSGAAIAPQALFSHLQCQQRRLAGNIQNPHLGHERTVRLDHHRNANVLANMQGHRQPHGA